MRPERAAATREHSSAPLTHAPASRIPIVNLGYPDIHASDTSDCLVPRNLHPSIQRRREPTTAIMSGFGEQGPGGATGAPGRFGGSS
jgi:hypothetical protein